MATELQVRLTGLSAPGQFVDWARPFADLESCWNSCASPEFLLWLAARACTTTEERRAVVSCLAELTRCAERGRQRANPPVERAASAAETWIRSGASLDDLLAAEDRSRVGAFRFRGENGVFQRPKMPDRRTPEQLAELPAGTDKLQQFRALAKAIQTSSSIMITTGAASPVARFWENREEEKQCAHWFIPHLMR